jgi:nucleoside-diphosphate-sugar epimerase
VASCRGHVFATERQNGAGPGVTVRSLVTGAAGFIGSNLCEHLLAQGDEVWGVDAFTEYYSPDRKRRNLAAFAKSSRFRLVSGDLFTLGLEPLIAEVDVVYHLAGQPGVTASWGPAFGPYVQHNVLATQRLLEACRSHPLRKFVFASSSSVYGDAIAYPLSEDSATLPISPYGVTKLAAEHLCHTYRVAHGLPMAAMRLFTVYGPRQRPDMAFSRLIECALDGTTFELRGDGEQVRDCTFVGDVVSAMRAAAESEWTGVANVGGGSPASMNDVIELVSNLCGPVSVRRAAHAAGDVKRTEADIRVAAREFGFAPQTTLRAGLEAMVTEGRTQRVQA